MVEKDYVYCTAIIKSTNKVDYDQLIDIFKELEKNTSEEEGCISFQVIPMLKEKGTIALWEVWKDKEAFYKHHSFSHTIRIAEQKLTEVIVFESSVKLEI
ncbi:putative quinol monooxygenase [Mammaliicoccus sciuri]|uniref:putative quinol monooxygenase n=1 Tax=Mammaliicoccus sciuri TaxID=1296 RepID=UPI0034DCE70C